MIHTLPQLREKITGRICEPKPASSEFLGLAHDLLSELGVYELGRKSNPGEGLLESRLQVVKQHGLYELLSHDFEGSVHLLVGRPDPEFNNMFYNLVVVGDALAIADREEFEVFRRLCGKIGATEGVNRRYPPSGAQTFQVHIPLSAGTLKEPEVAYERARIVQPAHRAFVAYQRRRRVEENARIDGIVEGLMQD